MIQKLTNWSYRKPIVLMILSVGLWMLYPPIINHLVDQVSLFQVAAMAHSLAAVSTVLLALFIFRREILELTSQLFKKSRFRQISFPTLMSGILISANHLLLYGALHTSTDFDVIAILIFEIWPIMFLFIDTIFRRGKDKIGLNDYIFSGAAFAGFVVLTAPNMDFADWILLEGAMFKTVGLAFLGGAAMATNCFFRMKCMDGWEKVSADKNRPLTDFKKGLLTETFARSIAAPIFIVVLLFTQPVIPDIGITNILLIAFVGIFVLALGSLLYDLSVFQAQNASIGVLWYLMPIGSVVILSIANGRLMTQYEAVASVLIVSSNIFIALRYPLKSSLMSLFVAVNLIGVWLLILPVSTIDNYYDLLAVSTVFFVLLATFALERTTSLNREREDLLGDFRHKMTSVCEYSETGSHTENKTASKTDKVREYALLHLQTFLRIFANEDALSKIQERAEDIKAEILPSDCDDQDKRGFILDLFRVGDKLITLESDRISPAEYVILILLGSTNVLFSLIFRPDTLSASLFALIVATSVIYLLLIIYERDKYTQIRRDHALQCSNIMHYLQNLAPAPHSSPSPSEHSELFRITKQIEHALKTKTAQHTTRNVTYWVFAVFAFLMGGFGYGFIYQSSEKHYSPETSPLAENGPQNAEIEIALLDWPSAQLKARILAKIITEYIHRPATLVPVSNDIAFRQMNSPEGRIDILPEIWAQNNPTLIRRYVDAFGTVTLGKEKTIGRQGLCYTGLTESSSRQLGMEDLKQPGISQQFDVSGDGVGDIWVGDENWTSSKIERRRLTAFGLSSLYDYRVFDYQILSMLVQRNNLTKRPALFFCYYPDTIFARADVRFVEDGEYHKDIWDRIVKTNDITTKTNSTAWPLVDIRIAYRTDLERSYPALQNLLSNFKIPNKELVGLLSKLEAPGSTDIVANEWVSNNSDRILGWLTGFDLKAK
ncbi:glycine betaine ABC transporter substrate-binding protein [Thalassospira alkalitolerans]|uniref:glycine betaine ABC transporter substrate-binding protein n=1 Tax=Thalassospira alkalitolerans TaxID=1293890 RepID=UPI0030EE9C11